MKKIFTLSILALTTAFILTSCVKDSYYGINENYWLSKERGKVVYSDNYCNYYVVETNNRYTIIRMYGDYKPYEESIVYGDLSYLGTHEIYNRSAGITFNGTVTDYGLSYQEALDALDYYCPLGNKGQSKRF